MSLIGQSNHSVRRSPIKPLAAPLRTICSTELARMCALLLVIVVWLRLNYGYTQTILFETQSTKNLPSSDEVDSTRSTVDALHNSRVFRAIQENTRLMTDTRGKCFRLIGFAVPSPICKEVVDIEKTSNRTYATSDREKRACVLTVCVKFWSSTNVNFATIHGLVFKVAMLPDQLGYTRWVALYFIPLPFSPNKEDTAQVDHPNEKVSDWNSTFLQYCYMAALVAMTCVVLLCMCMFRKRFFCHPSSVGSVTNEDESSAHKVDICNFIDSAIA